MNVKCRICHKWLMLPESMVDAVMEHLDATIGLDQFDIEGMEVECKECVTKELEKVVYHNAHSN